MKIIILSENGLNRASFTVNYLRDVFPELMKDVVLAAIKPASDMNEWANEQTDFTYVYFEDRTPVGSALNQIIEGLELDDDILIMDDCHIPLVGSIDRLLDGLKKEPDAFAVGPVSNSFNYQQRADWTDAEAALGWSENEQKDSLDETLYLHYGVILFSKNVVDSGKTFNDETGNICDTVVEKCVREYLDHKRMYICRDSGFWDTRGIDYKEVGLAGINMLEKNFGIHYLNVGGNECIINSISECIDYEEKLKILEIGCDCGGTLFWIKKKYKNAELYGTDINENSLRFASEFATVKVNNIEDKDLDFGDNDFDLIIFGDVLEHLRDPLGAILYCKKLLKKGGRIAASIPNLMNIEVMKHLLNGNFPYAEYGLLDRTHIHMFTYNEIIRMFVNEAGYSIESISMNGELSGENEELADKLVLLGTAEKFMYQAFQYQIIARMD